MISIQWYYKYIFKYSQIQNTIEVFRNHTMLTTPWSELNFSTSWSDPNFNCLPQWQVTQLSAYIVHSQLPAAWLDPNFSTPWSELNSMAENSIVCLHGPILNPQHHCQTQLLYIMVGSQLQLSGIEADNPTFCLHGPKSTPNWLFFKILKFSGPSLLGMTSFTLQPIFYLGFIMTVVIVISLARERKLYPVLCTWTKSRIVQSPTKLNDKI